MSDTIFIKGLSIHARHGYLDYEAEVGQRFVIDLELTADIADASISDKLSDTVSYANVVAVATAAFKDANYKLLERAAGAVAEAVLSAFPKVSTINVPPPPSYSPLRLSFLPVKNKCRLKSLRFEV